MAFGFFDTTYEPDARAFDVQAAELHAILTHCVPIYGEWVSNGESLPGGRLRARRCRTASLRPISDCAEPHRFFPRARARQRGD